MNLKPGTSHLSPNAEAIVNQAIQWAKDRWPYPPITAPDDMDSLPINWEPIKKAAHKMDVAAILGDIPQLKTAAREYCLAWKKQYATAHRND